MQLVETLKVNANYLSIYDTVLDGQPNTSNTAKINFTDTFHDCRMSASAVKQIKSAVNIILYLARRKHYQEKYKKISCTGYRKNDLTERAKFESKNLHLCTFVTLTLPSKQKHTDKEITEFCINPFLAYSRKYFKIRYYVWKKELQKNGNLHFHFVTDRYIDALSLRRAWNRIINRGYIDGVKEKFDYVDSFHNNQINFYKDGWNDHKMKSYFSTNQNVIEKVDSLIKELQLKEKRNISFSEYQKIFDSEVNKAFERAKNIYFNEISKPEKKRFTNPNSTDIKAVNNPQTVSAYIAKYIAKDIDDNPEIINYQNEADSLKNCIFGILRSIEDKKEKGENFESELETLSKFKNALSEHRKKCPICGKLWFKSATLTPFLKGITISNKNGKIIRKCAVDFVHNDLKKELDELIKYLQNKSNSSKKLVLYNYEINPDGTENKDKIICITLLINIFELQTLYTHGSHCRLLFPEIVRLWRQFVFSCIQENRKKGLYEDFKKDYEEFETIKK